MGVDRRCGGRRGLWCSGSHAADSLLFLCSSTEQKKKPWKPASGISGPHTPNHLDPHPLRVPVLLHITLPEMTPTVPPKIMMNAPVGAAAATPPPTLYNKFDVSPGQQYCPCERCSLWLLSTLAR